MVGPLILTVRNSAIVEVRFSQFMRLHSCVPAEYKDSQSAFVRLERLTKKRFNSSLLDWSFSQFSFNLVSSIQLNAAFKPKSIRFNFSAGKEKI